jgi:chromosomal replication initiator protein
MAEVIDYTPSRLSCRPFWVQSELAADERIEALEAALLRITAVPEGVASPVVALAQRALADLAGIRTNRPLEAISNQIAHDFRLRPPDLQSKSQEQRIVFVRQLTMFLCRKITGAPFKSIGEHFHRDHSTVIHGYRVIEERVRRDAAFRRFIERLEGRITRMVQAHTAAV